jgi:prepilin-type N-terminal cleavage/methylation domain-containing protein
MKKINAFTLIEMIVSMTLFAILGIGLFSIMIALKKGDAAVSAKLDLNRELYYVTETIAKLIAESGTLDYEEYWNLKQLNNSTASSEYGNAGPNAFVACGSTTTTKRDLTACYTTSNQQRYWQYAKSFIDTNGDANNDTESCKNQWKAGMPLWDSNCDGNVYGDEDDEHTWIWPGALGLSNGTGVTITVNSIYKGTLALIKTSSIPQQRLLIRHAFVEDPDDTIRCDTTTGNGCRWELQIRRLEGYDLGFNHDGTWTWANDGQVDTWVCSPLFPCKWSPIKLPNWDDANLPNDDPTEWISLFPQHIHVPSIEWIVGPSDDPRQSWQLGSAVSSQFVRMRITLSFSARVRNKFGKNFAPTTLVSTFRIWDDSQ